MKYQSQQVMLKWAILVVLPLKFSILYCAVTVSDRNCNLHVTAKSVTPFIISLHWVSHQLPHHCKIYDEIKVMCHGTRSCTDKSGTESTHQFTSTHYYPLISETGLMDTLQPNTKYLCSVFLLIIGKTSQQPSHSFTVETGLASPEPPNRPEINRKDKNTLVVTIYNTSNCNGPISGYEIQFHLMDNAPTDEDNKPLLPENTYKPISGNLPSIKEAQDSTQPLSFYIREMRETILIDERSLMGRALKRNSTYTVVTSAYTHVQGKELLYSHSLPSNIIGFGAETMMKYSISSRLAVTKSYGHRVLYAVMCALLILSFLGTFLLCYKLQSFKLRTKRCKMYKLLKTTHHDDTTPRLISVNASSQNPTHSIEPSSGRYPQYAVPVESPKFPLSPYFNSSPYIEPPAPPRPSSNHKRVPLHSQLYYHNGTINPNLASLSARPDFVPPLQLQVPMPGFAGQPVPHTLSPLGPMSPSLLPLLQSPMSPSLVPPPHKTHPKAEPLGPKGIARSHSSPLLMQVSDSVILTYSPPPPTLTTPALFSSLSVEDSGLTVDHAPDLELQFSDFNLYPFSRSTSPLRLPHNYFPKSSSHLLLPYSRIPKSSSNLSSNYYLAPLMPNECSSAYLTANTSPAESFFLAPQEPFDNSAQTFTIKINNEDSEVFHSSFKIREPTHPFNIKPSLNTRDFLTPPTSPRRRRPHPSSSINIFYSSKGFQSSHFLQSEMQNNEKSNELIRAIKQSSNEDSKDVTFYSCNDLPNSTNLHSYSSTTLEDKREVYVWRGGRRERSSFVNVKAMQRLLTGNSSASSIELVG